MTDEPTAPMQLPRVFGISCWDKCQEKWIVQELVLCRCTAIKKAQENEQRAARCNNLEFWRVEEYVLNPCTGKYVVWGPTEVITGDCLT